MASDATSLRIVNLNCRFWADLRPFNIEKAVVVSLDRYPIKYSLDVVTPCVNDRKHQQRIRNLSMKPY
jgi:hypothetical protein